MANEITKIEDLLTQTEPVVIADKFLHVSTISDGYTNTVGGTYVYAVKAEGEDYAVAEMLYNAETGKLTQSPDPVILTNGNTIFYVARTTSDPYDFPVIGEETVQSFETKEKQVLQAFLAFAKDNFSLGIYNSFLAETPYVYGEKTVTP